MNTMSPYHFPAPSTKNKEADVIHDMYLCIVVLPWSWHYKYVTTIENDQN